MRIKKINNFEKNRKTEIKIVIKELRIEKKINELANNLDIRLIKQFKNFFLILKNTSAMEKILE